MTYNIPQHISGDTWDGIGLITFTRNGSALDLTGASVSMGVKLSISSPDVLTLTTENSAIAIMNAVSGQVRILPRIIDIPVGKYSWYFTLKLATQEVKTYLMGTWSIIPNIPIVTEYERRNYN